MSNGSKKIVLGGLALLAVGALTTSANAQLNCTGTPTGSCTPACTTGPDVIVGDLQGPTNYTQSGSIDALSMGTVSCNPGNVWVNWFQNTTEHPVIGQTLYKYSVVNGAGRFEQVGQSWLKHAFFALSETLCCSGCQSTDGTHLGIHCADTYTSSRNGSQGGLGPKWQVNANTGVFTYPPANPGGSGSVYRRLEVDTGELLVSNGSTVRYFGEGQYVTHDDATARNQNNNCSFRELSATNPGGSAGWSFAFGGTLGGATQRTQQAIRAWPLADSGAQLVDVQVTNGGLYVVGFHATAIAGGLYHYEYAVYNMNDDSNGGSFSVPVSAGVNVTNIGFHDVAYRDGDGPGNVNFDGTDWVGTVAGGAITWSTTPFNVNQSANAIRWGTTYNFRFDADAAPTSATATLGLWKTGAQMTATVDAPGQGGGPTNYAYCFGDGSGTACPCGNNSAVGSNTGCLNSLGTGGQLVATGTPSIGADTFVLGGSGMPDSSALYFQGTTQSNGGAGVLFGDGLRCAGGTTIRLGTELNALGTSQYPTGGDLAVSVKGGISSPATYTYQVWYRNPASFCQPETFNLTNAWQATWVP